MSYPLIEEVESRRLAVLDRLEILDTDAESIYDDTVELASEICGVPIAAISLVDRDRQFFKARVGIDIAGTPRSDSFCAHAIYQAEPLVVPDASADPRFASNPLVTGDAHLRFYASAQLYVEGTAVGAICVIDRKPRQITPSQLQALETLARQVSACLDLRLAARKLSEQGAALEKSLAESEELGRLFAYNAKRFEALFQSLPVPCAGVSTEGRIMETNRDFERVFGWKSFEAYDRDIRDLLLPKAGAAELKGFSASLKPDSSETRHEILVRHKDGHERWLLAGSHALSNCEGQTTGLLWSCVDITGRKAAETALATSHALIERQKAELEAMNAQLERVADLDPLTGLKNRRASHKYLAATVENARLHHFDISLLLIDLDHFKNINDQFGHAVGDSVLERVASILRDLAGPDDLVARFGGEEFLLGRPHSNTEQALAYAEHIRRTFQREAWEFGRLTVSIGVASTSEGVTHIGALLQKADEALYRAKNSGRNRVEAYGIEESDGLAPGQVRQKLAG